MFMSANADLVASAPARSPHEIPLDLIDGPEVLLNNGFAATIATHGVLVPIIVRRNGARYCLVAGRRRLTAARKAKHERILAVVHDDGDEVSDATYTIVENLHRARSIVSELAAFQTLVNAGRQDDEVQALLGLPKRDFRVLTQLLNLAPEGVQVLVEGRMSASSAKILAKMPLAEQRELLFRIEPTQRVTLEQVRKSRLRFQYRPTQLDFLASAVPDVKVKP
jgi:ParB/RepB/Spo0J family partition protein